jgi:malonate transporter and related proteins
MIMTILMVTLPIVITLLFGFIAAWRHDFNNKDATVLNRMVLTYAVPMSIFAGTVSTSKAYLLESIPLLLTLTITIIGLYALVYFVFCYVFKCSLSLSALSAVTVAGPAVPFFGPAILEGLFGVSAAVPIAIGSIVINVTIVPFTVFLLTMGRMQNPTMATESKPVLAVIVVLLGFNSPPLLSKSLELLGKTSAGVALFASGIMLAAYKLKLDALTWSLVILKNIFAPILVYIVARSFGIDMHLISQALITMAIPAMPIIVVFAIEYKVAEKNMPSVLLLSTILSPLTIGGFIALISELG